MTDDSTLTLGSFVKLLFDLSGIMPVKGDDDALFNETEKKSLQTLLRRLQKEDGDLINNYSKAFEKLKKSLTSICPDEALTLFCIEFIYEIEEVYRRALQDDGTYLDVTETLKWLLSESLCSRLVLSLYKNLYRYGIHQSILPRPKEPFWFLPDCNSNKTALSAFLKWLYEDFDTTQTTFHFPECCNTQETFMKERNLANAQKWCRGERIPSWVGLKQNLVDALAARGDLSDKYKQNILFMAFVARLITKVCDAIESKFGRAYLLSLAEQFKEFDAAFRPHIKDMEHITQETSKLNPVNPFIIVNKAAFDNITVYWQQVADETHQLAQHLQAIQMQKLQNGENYEIADYRDDFSSEFMFQSLSNGLACAIEPPQPVFDIIGQCYQLMKSNNLDHDSIVALEDKMGATPETRRLQWYIYWIKGKAAYNTNQMVQALSYYDRAFMHAKYRAGRQQFQLVNELILIAAKCNDWKTFKKVVTWANFVEIKIKRTFFPIDTASDMKAFFEQLQQTN